MKFLKGIFNFYINSSIHVALAVCALAMVTCLNADVVITKRLIAFLFLSTITGYNFVKYAGVAKLHYKTLTRNLKIIQLFSLVCFVLLVYLVYLQTKQFLWTTTLLGMITLLYAIPFLPKSKSLRNLKTLKIFVIAWVWSGATVLLPLVDDKNIFSAEVIFTFIQYYLFILALMIPFEIRDLAYDRSELGTFPQLIGVEKSKNFAYLLLVAFVGMEFVISGIEVPKLIIVGLIVIVTALFVRFSQLKQQEYYASFWVEAIPIIWLGLVVLSKV